MKQSEQLRRTGLARMLSKLGHCSRTQGFALVHAGRVAVNGRVRRDPEFAVREGDHVAVDGRPVGASDKIYLMMNKPRGLVTTASDEKGRATVYSILNSELPWVAPVGRLDQASEGLLLFTNDPEWAAKITSPTSRVEKTYRVQIAAVADQGLLIELTEGMADGHEVLRAVRASILRSGKRTSWIEIVLDEGRNRHIRRMFAAKGIEVLRLIRVAVGPIVLGDLAKGQFRALTPAEKRSLDRNLHALPAMAPGNNPRIGR